MKVETLISSIGRKYAITNIAELVPPSYRELAMLGFSGQLKPQY